MPDKELSVSFCGCFRNVSLGESEGRSEGMLGKQCPFLAFALGVKNWDVVRKDNFLPLHNDKHFLSQIKSF